MINCMKNGAFIALWYDFNHARYIYPAKISVFTGTNHTGSCFVKTSWKFSQNNHTSTWFMKTSSGYSQNNHTNGLYRFMQGSILTDWLHACGKSTVSECKASTIYTTS